MRRVVDGFHAMNVNIIFIFAKSKYVSNLGFVLCIIVPTHGLSFREPVTLFPVIAEGVRFSRIFWLDTLRNGRNDDSSGVCCEGWHRGLV
jgi:hypothetical protein